MKHKQASAIPVRTLLGLLLVLLGVIGAGLWLGSRSEESPPPTSAASASSAAAVPPTRVSTDPGDIFQRAFWRRPTPEDRVLHAERREWADANGVNRWAWFLAVEPGSALLADLREHNTLQLRPGTAPRLDNAPEWFTPEAVADVRCREGLYLYCGPGDLLYATASGQGFTPPVKR